VSGGPQAAPHKAERCNGLPHSVELVIWDTVTGGCGHAGAKVCLIRGKPAPIVYGHDSKFSLAGRMR
jgi:hypothetical protein